MFVPAEAGRDECIGLLALDDLAVATFDTLKLHGHSPIKDRHPLPDESGMPRLWSRKG